MFGDEFNIVLELKLFVDVGLLGFFNVGKLILFLMIIKVKLKIVNYYFIILKFNLGVVVVDGIEFFVMVDILGIIEGVVEGVGFGI